MSTLTNLPSLSSVDAASKRHKPRKAQPQPESKYDPTITPFDPLCLYDLSTVGLEFEPGVELKRLKEHQNRRDELLVRSWKESFLIEGADRTSQPPHYISLKRYENRVELSNCLMTALFSIVLAALGGYIYGIILLQYAAKLILP